MDLYAKFHCSSWPRSYCVVGVQTSYLVNLGLGWVVTILSNFSLDSCIALYWY